jgi:hypothetical protein
VANENCEGNETSISKIARCCLPSKNVVEDGAAIKYHTKQQIEHPVKDVACKTG